MIRPERGLRTFRHCTQRAHPCGIGFEILWIGHTAVDRLTPGGSVDGADDMLGGLLDNLPGGLGGALGGLFKR